jgi:ribosomal protein L11 methyltransferase
MLFKLRVSAADLAAGRTAAGVIGELVSPEPLAVTLFEDKPPRFVVEAYYAAAPALEVIADALAGLPNLGAPSLAAVPEQNWVALSQAALPPIRAGRLVVHAGHDRQRFAMRRHALEIEAGEAFGTGHNATTALCLEAVDRLARARRFKRVLDLGCGSGVLAIAAARSFPGVRVLAVDNDPLATAVARANARLNRVAGSVRVLDAMGFDHALVRRAQPFDLVLANLLPNPLIALAPRMRRAIAPGGIAVLSGLLDHQAREVRATYAAAGFRLVYQRSRAGWTALMLARHCHAGACPRHPAIRNRRSKRNGGSRRQAPG